ncbi:polypeptide N-acetylgalactosaminyltransferase-like 6 [Acanthaster planci]|uniref:Polypeptide N-acetylgalactosaminyltransferase n=1 Tax=Acanthaster planci TaxID=133434 RepID=A0A8B7XZ69_ACAPL|nr:polypeptide N-acetylgalactosaminyltransferase-like 6 [Acanthaster planci]
MRIHIRRMLQYLVFIFLLFFVGTVLIKKGSEDMEPGRAQGRKVHGDGAGAGDGDIIRRNQDNAVLPGLHVPQNGALPPGAAGGGNQFRNFAVGEQVLRKKDWHDYERIQAEKLKTGPGEHGTGVVLTPDLKRTAAADTKANGFNERVSDMISLDRSLKDIRNLRCKEIQYLEKLPNASIVIPFHNEAMSTLKRTVHSVINQSPPELIHEIILVDDYSDRKYLKQPLEEYMQRFSKVKILRMDKREGLIRTRLYGGRQATGEVLIYLDSHCEANTNWLPPLLERIALNRKCIACPMIDVIGNEDFHYESQAGDIMRGAFDWELYYKRIPINNAEMKRRQFDTDPVKTPIMAGGLFAVDRRYFFDELGGYDEGLEVWGGEQYDLSFKVWLCGGEMEEVPCSRVGHVYRKFMSYTVPGGGGVIHKNLMRVVEVWFDDWKKYFYMHKPHLKGMNYGDISKQLALKERLQCKNFTYFMNVIAPDIMQYYPPVEPDPGATGFMQHVESGLCLTFTQGRKLEIILEPCLPSRQKKGGNQYFTLSWHDDLRPGRNEKQCVDYPNRVEGGEPILYPCHGGRGNQLWVYNPTYKLLYHPTSELCLSILPSVSKGQDGKAVTMVKCSKSNPALSWKFEKTFKKVLTRLNQQYPIVFK